MTQPKQKRFVIKKYIMAQSALEAIRKERKAVVDDVWVDDEWLKKNTEEGSLIIGFTAKK